MHLAEVPASWERAIARCLEVEPGKRFARAGDVIDALDARVPRRWTPWLVGGALAVGAAAGAAVLMHHDHTAVAAKGVRPARGIIVVDPRGTEAWRATEAGELMRAALRVRGHVTPQGGDETASLTRPLALAKDGEARKAALVGIAAQTTAQLSITSELTHGGLQLRLIDLPPARMSGRSRRQ